MAFEEVPISNSITRYKKSELSVEEQKQAIIPMTIIRLPVMKRSEGRAKFKWGITWKIFPIDELIQRPHKRRIKPTICVKEVLLAILKKLWQMVGD